MKKIMSVLFLLFVSCVMIPVSTFAVPIINGDMSEWGYISPTIQDPQGDIPWPGVSDLKEMKISRTEDNTFFLLSYYEKTGSDFLRISGETNDFYVLITGDYVDMVPDGEIIFAFSGTGKEVEFMIPISSTAGDLSVTHLMDMGVGTAPVPEPASLFLLGTGLVGIAGIRRKMNNKSRFNFKHRRK